MERKRLRKLKCYTFFVALLFFIFLSVGIFSPMIIKYYLTEQIKNQIIIDSFDSPGVATWQSNTGSDDPPVWLNFYIFNVTNPQEVELGGIPTLVEVGPYSYREMNVYFNISFLEDGNKRSFRKWQYFLWDPAHSFPGANPEQDDVVVVNAPFQAVLGTLLKTQTGGDWWETLLFDLLASASQSSLFVNLTVEQLIWGYNDPLLSLVHTLNPEVPPTFQLQANLTEDQIYASTGLTVVQTGKDDINNIGNIQIWQGQNSLSCWGSVASNTIGGNYDNNFPPFLDSSQPIYLWVDQLFRKGYFKFDKEVEVYGIKLYSYKIPNEELDNATQYPPNDGFYQYGPSGVANLTSPTGGAPIFISKPHFLDADPYYLQHVNMTPPDPNLHQTYLQLEPITGALMVGCKRLQINVNFQLDALLYPLVNKDIYIPLAWVEETGGITEDLANEFKSIVYKVENISLGLQWGGYAVAGVCFIIFIILLIKIIRTSRSSKGLTADYTVIQSDE